MKVLIVGAAAVSGRAAMKAARSLGATIVATTSRESNVDGADETIYGVDLEKENAVEKILSDTRVKNIDYIVYIPARGAVGMDITESTAEMIPPSLAYSVEP
ncbi:MAG TPA: NAD-dependent epimerase/dehydratase family protein, partial [Turneriella sp.]|nr:NAD-dependent epimerase/dehydratase family protein [Turneriella sp.]